jgi:hypothetical protein
VLDSVEHAEQHGDLNPDLAETVSSVKPRRSKGADGAQEAPQICGSPSITSSVADIQLSCWRFSTDDAIRSKMTFMRRVSATCCS